MTTIQQTPVVARPTGPGRRVALRVTRWVMAVVGGVLAFLGGFILLGGDDEYIGIGGEVSWRVGDIDPLWGWGLLAGGLILLAGGIAMLLVNRSAASAGTDTAESPGADLVAHAAIFTLVNALLWVQDIIITGGVNYVLWVTLPWAIGLGAHAVAYVVGRRA